MNMSACQNTEPGCLYPTDQPTPDHQGGQTEQTGLPLVYASLLLSLNPQSQLDTPGGYFSPDLYKVTKNGKPVSKDPDDISPPQFEANIGTNVSFIVTPNHTEFQLRLGDHLLTGYTLRPVAWGPNGEGPESFLGKFHLPVHWFVYSLSSQVRYYKYANLATGQVVIGRSTPGSPVIAHMEKNWGKSFPKAWVWAEGVDPVANVSFAFSAGIITEFRIDVKAQLSGYRNPGKEITCSFHPLNSIHSLQHNGCAGTATLKVESLDCAVTFVLTAHPDSFSSCLEAPGAAGFQKGCVESYTATATITVFQRKGGSMVLSDNHTITMAALEFGAACMCNGRCPDKGLYM